MTNEEKILQMLLEMNGRLGNIEQEAVKTNERLTGVEQGLTGVEHRLTGVEHRLTGVEQRLTGVEQRLTSVEQEAVKTNLKIENDITKRLDLLTDGYILTHEKQYELERKFERKIEGLEKRIEQLEVKAG